MKADLFASVIVTCTPMTKGSIKALLKRVPAASRSQMAQIVPASGEQLHDAVNRCVADCLHKHVVQDMRERYPNSPDPEPTELLRDGDWSPNGEVHELFPPVGMYVSVPSESVPPVPWVFPYETDSGTTEYATASFYVVAFGMDSKA
ncbi:MAG: hypothetical protein AAGB51_03730 [Planctomycetota bacterium]